MDQTDITAVRQCICANVRRADRAITQFYDAMLAPSGLHITQFTLLGTIMEAEPITIQHLAEYMVMDRTTLTRNLAYLTKQALVRIDEGEDRRVRLVTLTDAGRQTLAQALPLWKEAQSRMVQQLGQLHAEVLLSELANVVETDR